MRIIGGSSRGRRLAGSAGSRLRPTADQVKAALFNILSPYIPNARFLDLFAGCGTVGIEALSRGAKEVTFVESHPRTCRVLRDNLRRCGLEKRADVRPISVSRFLQHPPIHPYDVIFLDPPYHTFEGKKVLPSLGRGAIIRPDGVVVIEHFHKTRLAERIDHLNLAKTYRYGDTCLSVYRYMPDEDAV